MLRLIGVVISVGLADSLNPSTVGPALYIATARQRVLRVIAVHDRRVQRKLLAGGWC